MEIALLLAFPILASLATAVLSRDRIYVIEYAAAIVTALEIFLALWIARTSVESRAVSIDGIFMVDALGSFLLLFTTVVGFAATIHSIGHLREEVRKGIIGFRRVRQYFVLLHLFLFAMFVSAATASPLVAWVAIEATTLAAVFLITFYNKPSALEAGWKLLILNSVGLLLGFLGTLLFLHAAAEAGGSGTFVSWSTLRELGSAFDPLLVKLAFIFCLVGYGTKVGFVPMHTWLPDAHSKAPVPISALLSGVLLNVALVALLRFRSVVDMSVGPEFTQDLLIFFGTLSLIVSVLIIFVQKNYKRMLAYSSIEHMGVMGLGFGIGASASGAALFHMLYHALLKPILFLSAGNIFLKYSSTKIALVRGALNTLPISSGVFLAALVAISGVPISGIFFTKLAILSAGMAEHPYFMLLALAAFTIVFAGFIRHATYMLFGDAPADIQKGEANNWTLASIIFLSVLFVVLSVWIPDMLTTLVTKASSLIN